LGTINLQQSMQLWENFKTISNQYKKTIKQVSDFKKFKQSKQLFEEE
jgi:hypothetical protein